MVEAESLVVANMLLPAAESLFAQGTLTAFFTRRSPPAPLPVIALLVVEEFGMLRPHLLEGRFEHLPIPGYGVARDLLQLPGLLLRGLLLLLLAIRLLLLALSPTAITPQRIA